MTAVSGRGAGFSYLRSDGGTGTPIILLHGIGSNARSFEPLMQALAFPTIAWDAPGYGESEPLAEEWPDASDYATALQRLLAHLQVKECAVAGHSLGALIAARYAVQFATRVTAIFLISPARGYRSEKGKSLPPAVAKRIEELDALGPQKFAQRRAPGLLADPAANGPVLRAVQRAMAAVRRPGYDQAARLLAGGRLIEDAEKIELPAAVIVASDDRITPPESGHAVFAVLEASSRRCAFKTVANAGHAVCQEKPVEVARLIGEFLASEAMRMGDAYA
jgi:pimeloyl-ACP methyl ester carboxylesterase